MKRPFFIVLMILSIIYSCNDSDKVADEISKINIDLKVSRFDKEYSNAKEADISNLKKTYPYLFPAQYPDSVWVNQLKDTIQIELFSEVQKAFPEFNNEHDELEALFQHIKYYFPKTKTPKVVTVTSYVDYRNRVILADSLLLIGLDNYLGAEHHFYKEISEYIALGLDKKFLASDVANEYISTKVAPSKDRTFLGRIIYYGKRLYLKDKLMPNADDTVKIGYTKEELAWAQENEDPIWRNFIEQEHLYSTDAELSKRFLDPAPFSKFGLELDIESPGRIGQYIGWQIVKVFMEKNEVSLEQLLSVPADEILKKSNYKPKK